MFNKMNNTELTVHKKAFKKPKLGMFAQEETVNAKQISQFFRPHLI